MDDIFIAFSLGLLLAATFSAGPAQSQTANCATHETVSDRLAQGYGEARQTIALSADNTVVETWANPDTGTWTITVTSAGGLTCLVASGQAFEILAEPLPPSGEGA